MVTSIPSNSTLKLAWTSVTSSNNNIMTVCSQNNQLRTYARFHKTWLSLRYRFSRLFKTWDFGENVIMLYKMSWNAYTCSITMAENRKSKA